MKTSRKHRRKSQMIRVFRKFRMKMCLWPLEELSADCSITSSMCAKHSHLVSFRCSFLEATENGEKKLLN